MPLIDDPAKRRFRKLVKQKRRDAVELGQQADQKIEKLLLRRFDRLISVRRFVSLWMALMVLAFFALVFQLRALSPHYQSLRPAPGGLYSEGLVGTFTNANPIYATGAADSAVSRLVFSGLFKYNKNNRLVGDLAKKFQVSKDRRTYTVALKQNITWHDGQPFTANDVVYTYRTIQNPEAQSSLRSSWEDIRVTKKDNHSVQFTLPNPLTSFPHSLINGIIPAHLLKNVEAVKLRSSTFNTRPVGTGPFVWKFVEVVDSGAATRQQRISLAAYENYWAGPPKIDGLSLLTFASEKQMIQAFVKERLNAIAGLEHLPEELAGDSDVSVYHTPLTSIVMAFYNNSDPVLQDAGIRQAMTRAVDHSKLVRLLQYPTNLADAPLLRGQIGYSSKATQLSYNPKQAGRLLSAAGWKVGAGGQRYRDKQPLEFTLRTQQSKNYSQVAEYLQKQWRKVGVKVDVRYYTADDLQSAIIANHEYDILLYGINIGVDPDVFAFWDSSQASVSATGLNLSEYKSSLADQVLADGRTRPSAKLRAIKYRNFLAQWRKDAPALALYQPNFTYITRGPVFNFDRHASNSSVDRFYNVNEWMVRQERQTL